MGKNIKLGDIDVEELACEIVGLDYDEIDADTETINVELQNKFGIDLHDFAQLMEKLLPMIDVGESILTHKKYKGFGKNGIWLLKQEI